MLDRAPVISVFWAIGIKVEAAGVFGGEVAHDLGDLIEASFFRAP
jgi:hypothetical protein